MARFLPDRASVELVAATLPDGDDALFRAGQDALLRYDAAVCGDDPAAAEAARAEYEAAVWKLNGGTTFASYAGAESAGTRMTAHCAARDGVPFRWGQRGAFIVQAEGMRAVLKADGGFFLGGGLAWHVVDFDKPFISETGYLSFLSAPIIWGATVAQAAPIWLRGLIRNERKPRPVSADAYARKRPDVWSHLEPEAVEAAAKAMVAKSYAAFPL